MLCTELLQLRQERDKAFRALTARVGGKAETYAFEAECVCGQSVDYTDHIIRDVLLNVSNSSKIIIQSFSNFLVLRNYLFIFDQSNFHFSIIFI